MSELSDKSLEGVNGGGVFANGEGQWEDINDGDGSVEAVFGSLTEARKYCAENGLDPSASAWQEVASLRCGDE